MGAGTARQRRQTTAAVLVVTAAAGVAAGFADTQPTGVPAADVVWTVLFAAGVTWCAAYAARWSWIILAGVAAVASVGAPGVVVATGVAGLGVALAAGIRRERSAVLGAVAAALAVQALLRLPEIGFSGGSALVSALAVAPLLYSAWRRSTRRVRRGAVWGVAVGAAVLAVLLVPAAISAVTTAREADVASDESEAWLEAAREGDQEAAVAHLEAAQRSFGEIEDATGGPLLWPARVLPVSGPQLAAVNTVAASGNAISSSAVDAARIATPENLRLQQGQVDLGLLREVRDPLGVASLGLTEARADLDDLNRTWLLPIVQSKLDEYGEQVDDAADDTELAVQALDVAPGLLGGDGTRTYLVLFGSPAETRELGGFVGNAAIVTATDGRIELEEVVRSRELNEMTYRLPPERLDQISVQGFPQRYLDYEPWRNWQNTTGTPDFPTVSAMVAELAPDAIGRPIDGVLYVDPVGLAGLLELTGPIEVEGLDEPIGADNVADFLLREQYVLYPETDERADFLEAVAERTFQLLTSSDLPGPRAIGRALGPPADEGHLRLWTFDPEEQALFARLGTSGSWGRSRADDDLLVTVANANPNKIDAYLQRDVSYTAELDPTTGRVQARVSVTLRNSAPLDLSDYVIGNANDEPQGTNRTFLSIYTGLGVAAASVDGTPAAFEAQTEYGLRRAGVFVSVPPEGATQIVFELEGTTDAATRGAYTLRVRQPALVRPDQVLVGFSAGGGATVGVPLLSGSVLDEPPPQTEPGSARFSMVGDVLVEFPLQR